MQLLKYLCLFLFPLLAIAIPAAIPEANPNPEALDLIGRSAEALELIGKTAALLPRQENGGLPLGGLIDLIQDLIKSIGPLLDLLNPDTFKQLASILKNANDLLTPEFVKQTKGLIADVAPVSLAPAPSSTRILG